MTPSTSEQNKRRWRLALALVSTALTWPLIAQPPLPDLCGCRNHPGSLGAFDTRVASTWPPGTTLTSSRNLTIPVPPDGVVVFDSMHLEWSTVTVPPCCSVEVFFQRTAANLPLTILVKGNVTIAGNATIWVNGGLGGAGSANAAGGGGLGSHGGFRGGDGAYRLANNATDGGAGLGPNGGLGATAVPQAAAGGASFLGALDLLPLVGGAGGGGGRSTSANTNCSGGGGGGGGGGLLLAANGTITLNNSNTGAINADGGNGGSAAGYPCGSGGAGGSGGAIRLIANTIAGSGRLYARGGRRWEDSIASGDGAIRLEAVTNTFGVTFADPIASRSTTPGPIVNPFTPSVTLTAVGGQPVPAVPQGVFGAVDVQVPVPGPTTIEFATDGVPTGTSVVVKVKPRVGGAPITQNVTLANCDASGRCLANLTVDLAAGTYSIEARATFQTP